MQAVRLDIRELEADRLNFEITRQSLITAARQVELARVQLLAPGQAGDSSTTQDVLRALDSLLASKNALISIWVSYETGRLRLLLDTEALQLGEDGLPTDFATDEPTSADSLPAPDSKELPEPASETLPAPDSETLPELESETIPVPSSPTLPVSNSEALPDPNAEILPHLEPPDVMDSVPPDTIDVEIEEEAPSPAIEFADDVQS